VNIIITPFVKTLERVATKQSIVELPNPTRGITAMFYGRIQVMESFKSNSRYVVFWLSSTYGKKN
jgi:hypothetical protein